ncbi:hypothetical protein [Paenibacillus lactis]|uniref:Uncharacterized protein n=1 Tax=Paenibacillus lactis 154 TaxID=743719 RepID=G4HEF4_9BACL|nr:hypothetical protein [Paenibacillus lactis]EHB65223.1 hypothetical protein PaelaDRAFT_2365 [Paenibacillus lactis 154]
MKKFVAIFLVLVGILGTSVAAFAEETNDSISPTAIGIGDTRETAITLFDNTLYDLYIQGNNDVDWYKWTNATGKAVFFNATIYPTAPGTQLNMGVIIDYGNFESTFLPGQKNEPTNGVIIQGLYIPNGASVFVKIGNSNSDTVQYRFNMLASGTD